MSICIDDSMVWSRLCWDKSWESQSDIDEILPKADQVYPVSFRQYHSLKSGVSSILWKPPQSDINGWYENRPSEISKSFVLDGVLSNPSSNRLNFDFLLLNKTRLVDVFNHAHKDEVSPKWDLEEDSHYKVRSTVGKYTYIFSSSEDSNLEVILSWEGRWLCVHYVASHCEYSHSWATITKYTPSRREHLLLERLLGKAQEIVDTSYDGVPESKVLGATYQ